MGVGGLTSRTRPLSLSSKAVPIQKTWAPGQRVSDSDKEEDTNLFQSAIAMGKDTSLAAPTAATQSWHPLRAFFCGELAHKFTSVEQNKS